MIGDFDVYSCWWTLKHNWRWWRKGWSCSISVFDMKIGMEKMILMFLDNRILMHMKMKFSILIQWSEWSFQKSNWKSIWCLLKMHIIKVFWENDVLIVDSEMEELEMDIEGKSSIGVWCGDMNSKENVWKISYWTAYSTNLWWLTKSFDVMELFDSPAIGWWEV